MLDDLFNKLFPKKEPAPTGPVEYIVVGLGNPGQKYEDTRHNAGALALDRMAEKLGTKVNRIGFKSLCGEAVIAGKKILLLKPTTYMNLSGQAVQEAMAYHKVPIEHVIVIFDDIALPQGVMRIKRKGSDGGHNGLKSIIYLTGKDTFPRIKIGIGGKPHPGMDLKDWVIGRLTEEEVKILTPVWDNTLTAVELMISGKFDEAMNRFNRAPEPAEKKEPGAKTEPQPSGEPKPAADDEKE